MTFLKWWDGKYQQENALENLRHHSWKLVWNLFVHNSINLTYRAKLTREQSRVIKNKTITVPINMTFLKCWDGKNQQENA